MSDSRETASDDRAPVSANNATRQREMAQALRESTEKYKTLLDAIDEGFCIVEVIFDAGGNALEYRFLEANPAFEKQTGMVDAVGKTMRQLRPEHEQHWFEIYGNIARTGEPARFEARAAALNRFYDVYAFRVGEVQQNRVAILFNDVSARKQVEQTLQEASRRKDEFLAVLAHELRNPLAPIRNGLQLVRLSSQVDSPLRHTVDMMDRQLTHLIRLVDDLLDVGRIESGKIELQLRLVSLADVLAASVESSQGLLDSLQHELVVDAQIDGPRVNGDFDRLAQVFSNLLSNAAKYTNPRGRITLGVRCEANEAVVIVRDTGIGIPAEEIPRVFDLFSQVAMHRSHTEGGLGIGLALVQRLVRMHGGSVTVKSDGPGAGSTFIVRLPLAGGELPDINGRAVESTGPPPSAIERRILVVDDNVDAADSLAMLLRSRGHDVKVTNGGMDAINQVVGFKPDLVFLDIGMPDLDGYETARRLRMLPGGAEMRLVALTGWGQEKDRQRIREAGFNDHLVKPADPSRLLGIVEAQ